MVFAYFIQRCDVIEVVNHEAIMAQLKEDLLLEKEQAIQEERRQCEQKLNQLKNEEKKDDQVIVSSLKLIINILFN